MTVLTPDQAQQIWERALNAKGNIEIRMENLKQAQRARFVLYTVRRKERETIAKQEELPLEFVDHDLANYTIALKEQEDGTCKLVIVRNKPFDSLEIIDTGSEEN